MDARTAGKIAAELFRPEMLRPNAQGHTLVVALEMDIAWECLGFEGSRCFVADILGGERTELIGTLLDPFVARKVASVSLGCGIPVRPGETLAEARAALEPWITEWESASPGL